MSFSKALGSTAFILLLVILHKTLSCQQIPALPHYASSLPYVGDAPENPSPLATDLSSTLRRLDVRKAILSVGDWQLEKAKGKFWRSWEFGAMYSGYVVAGKTLHHQEYLDSMAKIAESLDWKLQQPETNPDNQAVGQMFLDMAAIERRNSISNSLRNQFDELLISQQDAHPWSWCDTLFMAPPVWARLFASTGDQRYLDYIDRQWWHTSAELYVPEAGLYLRDSTYVNKREINGEKVFWSRGNGWVLAGLVQVLERMPEKDPSRAKYIQQFRDMSASIAKLQQPDGSWHASLLDPKSYDQPENSGTSFFVYGLAWGINHHLLDRATYLPVISSGWRELIAHIYADGRLGSIQPGGGAPAHFRPSSSYVYGVGAFLLAGSEVFKLSHP